MRPYLKIFKTSEAGARRIDSSAFARLFAEEDVQDELPTVRQAPLERITSAVQKALAPFAEITALLRDEHRARRLEARPTPVRTA